MNLLHIDAAMFLGRPLCLVFDMSSSSAGMNRLTTDGMPRGQGLVPDT